MTTTIRLNGPADVLTVLPYQLGFHPRQCLVAVSLRGSHSNRVGLVQRIDLPPSEHLGDAVDAMIAPLLQDAPESVLLIGFEEHEGQSRAMLDDMDDACGAYGIKVADRMVVRDGRWFDLDCVQSCCPPEGLPLPAPSEVPAVAEFVGREICPLPDRSALADLVEPNRPLLGRAVSRLAQEWLQLRHEATGTGPAGFPPGQREPVTAECELVTAECELVTAECELVTAECELVTAEREPVTAERDLVNADREFLTAERELHDFRASELVVWSRVLCDEDDAEPIRELPPQDLAMLAASLTDVDLRDGLIAWLCPGTLSLDLIDPVLSAQMSRVLAEPRVGGDVEGAGGIEQVIRLQRFERRLCELSAALPDGWAVPTLTVLASFSWWRGDGALTRIALDRALRVEPEYRLAQLLERMVDLAIRPERASA